MGKLTPKPGTDNTSREPKRNWPSLAQVLQVLTLAGIVGYPLLIMAYDRFYAPLGLRPEDVGLDRVAILTRTLGALPYFGLPLLGVIFVYWGLWLSGRLRPTPEFRNPRHPSHASAVRWYWANLAMCVISVVMVLALVQSLIRLLTLSVDLEVAYVRNGVRVEPVGRMGLTLVDLRAEPVYVEWIGDPNRRPLALHPGSPLRGLTDWVYLGQRDGIVVLYETPLGGVVRVPASQVHLTYFCAQEMGSEIGQCSRDVVNREDRTWYREMLELRRELLTEALSKASETPTAAEPSPTP